MQRRWADGLVDIGREYANRTHSTRRARELVDDLYGHGTRDVLFRATDTSEGHVRLTRESAVSYLIGRTPDFPNDYGFALQRWTEVRFDNAGGISVEGNHAEAMGLATFYDAKGLGTQLDYTFGYFRDGTGNLRIDLHFLSWPYGSSGRAAAGTWTVELPSARRSLTVMTVVGLGGVAAAGVGFAAFAGSGARPLGRVRGLNQPGFDDEGVQLMYGYG